MAFNILIYSSPAIPGEKKRRVRSLLPNRPVCALISHARLVHNRDWYEFQDGD